MENELNKSLRLVAKSSAIMLIGLAISKIVSYLYRIVIARNFGVETYGTFSLAVIIMEWFFVVSSLGLGLGLLRYVPIYKGKKEFSKIKFLLNKTTYLTLITSIFSGLLLLILAPKIAINIFKEPMLVNFLVFFSILIPIMSLLSIFLHILQAYEKISWNSFISNIFNNVVKLGLILLLLFLGLGQNSIIYSYILSALATLFLAFYIVKKEIYPSLPQKKSKKEKNTFKELIKYSFPILLASIVWKIFHWTDSLLIGYFQTVKEVGLYNAAIPIAFLLGIASQLFIVIFFPMVTREYFQGKKETVKELSKQVNKWIMFINLPILFFMFFFPDLIIKFLFGTEFLEAQIPLRILAIGMFFLNLSEVPNRLITMKGRPKMILADMLIMVAVNASLNFWLIPIYGITGAAISTSTTLVILSIVFSLQSHKLLGILPLRRKMLNVLIAGTISALFTFLIKTYLEPTLIASIFSVIFFISLYVLILIFSKAFDKNDLLILKETLSKLNFRPQ